MGMQEGLAQIKTMAGVQDTFICDSRGKVIAGVVSGGLNKATRTRIGREAALIMAALEAAGEPMGEMDCRYEGARLVVRTLANAVLMVLCEPQTDIAMLRLTLDVVTTRFKADSGMESQLDKARAAQKELAQEDVDEISWHLFKIFTERR